MIASPERVRSNLRCIWRLLQNNTLLSTSSMGPLMYLQHRYKSEKLLGGDVLCSFTTFFLEMLRNLMAMSTIPKAYRIAYRHLIIKFQSVNFFVAPVCTCCYRRVCMSEYFEAMPDEAFPLKTDFLRTNEDQFPTLEETVTLVSDLNPFSPTQTIFRLNEEYTETRDSVEKMSEEEREEGKKDAEDRLSDYMSALFCSKGEKRRKMMDRKLMESSIEALYTLMVQRDHKAVQVNDCVLEDLRFVGKAGKFDIDEVYRKQGFMYVFALLTRMFNDCGSSLAMEIATSLIRTFILCTHFRVNQCESDNWSFGMQSVNDPYGRPLTVSNLFWLDMWSLMKQNIHNSVKTTKETFSPCFFAEPIAQISPLIGNWIRMSFELAAINKLFTLGDSSKFESIATDTTIGIYKHLIEDWPPLFKTLLQKRLFQIFAQVDQNDNFIVQTYQPVTDELFDEFNARTLRDRKSKYGTNFD